MRRPAPAAFTLVELLVVIGIIALLISILLPALNKARAQANTAKCAANMRSAVQALHLYTTENKGWLPGPYTTGAVWKPSRDSMGLNESSSDETPLQNMDWVSPTMGKTQRFPENDYERQRIIFTTQLMCPSNGMQYSKVELNNEGLPVIGSDLPMASYSAVEQFQVWPSRDSGGEVTGEMFTKAGLICPTSYAPILNKVGRSSDKVFLVEGARYLDLNNTGTITSAATNQTFNAARYQKVGGNWMIGAPIHPFLNTPFQLPVSNGKNYTGKQLSPVAKAMAWRHNDKMNLAFFDGHVELRSPADSIQTRLYTPKGTQVYEPNLTYDPTDTKDQVVD